MLPPQHLFFIFYADKDTHRLLHWTTNRLRNHGTLKPKQLNGIQPLHNMTTGKRPKCHPVKHGSWCVCLPSARMTPHLHDDTQLKTFSVSVWGDEVSASKLAVLYMRSFDLFRPVPLSLHHAWWTCARNKTNCTHREFNTLSGVAI